MWGGQDRVRGRGEVSGRSKSRTERYTKRALFLTGDTVQLECVHTRQEELSALRETRHARLCVLICAYSMHHGCTVIKCFSGFFLVAFPVYIKLCCLL